jgi:hypothetical protein
VEAAFSAPAWDWQRQAEAREVLTKDPNATAHLAGRLLASLDENRAGWRCGT